MRARNLLATLIMKLLTLIIKEGGKYMVTELLKAKLAEITVKYHILLISGLGKYIVLLLR